MPGIVGCLSTTGTATEILLARKAMRYSITSKDDSLYENALIRCTRTHLNVIGEKKSPVRKKDTLAWVEGEFYNIDQLKAEYKLDSQSEGEILLEAYAKGTIRKLLKSIDGYFCAVLYDTRKKTISFVTDRYGLKPLYVWAKNGQLVFGSELKCFLSFKSFTPKVKKLSVNFFLAFGHLSGNNTWFEDVFLLEASTFVTYSLSEKRISEKFRYWNWSNIKKLDISFEDASEYLVELLKLAVRKRISSSINKYSLSLSGGLDSRAILACVPEDSILEAFTFGRKSCDDVRIARKVATQKGFIHHFFELNKKNWFNKRIEGIWRNDGAINFLHLHATQYHENISEVAPISLNGFAGDLIMGGSYLKNCDQRIQRSSIPSIISADNTLDIEHDFFDIQKEDPFYIDFRVRRFTASGLNEIKFFENRIPFFDNQLIEFIYSLPDSYRWRNKLYTKLLTSGFPSLFRRIPTPGVLYPPTVEKAHYHRILNLLSRGLKKAGLKHSSFAPYNEWIDIDSFKKVFYNSDNIITSLTLNQKEQSSVYQYSGLEQVTRLFSIEIWLQQVFNSKYLTTEEFFE